MWSSESYLTVETIDCNFLLTCRFVCGYFIFIREQYFNCCYVLHRNMITLNNTFILHLLVLPESSENLAAVFPQDSPLETKYSDKFLISTNGRPNSCMAHSQTSWHDSASKLRSSFVRTSGRTCTDCVHIYIVVEPYS